MLSPTHAITCVCKIVMPSVGWNLKLVPEGIFLITVLRTQQQ